MRNYIQRFEEYIEKEGVEGLLPHNLADDILERFLEEADVLHCGGNTRAPASTLLLAVLYLSAKGNMSYKSRNIELTMSPEELQEKFGIYITLMAIEEINRKSGMTLKSEDLVTLDNIFDNNQKFQAFKS